MTDRVAPVALGFFRICALTVLAMICLFVERGSAQSPTPTVVDFWTSENRVFLEISLNAEAFVTELDPSSPNLEDNKRYRGLRALASSELEPQVRAFAIPWMETLNVQAKAPLGLSYEGVRIPVAGDAADPRISRLLLTADLPASASTLKLTWPTGYGPVILRQQRVAAPYTGYLNAGETSPEIPLQGGSALSAEQTLAVFFPKGLLGVVQQGTHQLLLVLTIVALSFRLQPVVVQTVFFFAGALSGLVLGSFNLLNWSPAMVEQSVLIAVVVLALWNLIARRLGVWRLLAVVAIGALQGVGSANALTDIGVPPDHMPQALLGYVAGTISAMTVVALGALGLATLFSGRSHRLRARLSVLVSMIFAALAVYLLVEPLLPV